MLGASPILGPGQGLSGHVAERGVEMSSRMGDFEYNKDISLLVYKDF